MKAYPGGTLSDASGMENQPSAMALPVPHCAFFSPFFLQALAATFLKGLADDLRECTPSYFVTGCSLKLLWVNVRMLQVRLMRFS